MKKLLLLLFMLIIVNLNAQEVLILQKGEKAPFDGKFMTIERYNKLITRAMQADIYEKELLPGEKEATGKASEIIAIQKQSIEVYKQKYNLAEMKINILKEENKKLKFVNNILIITNNIGWTISLGYTGGIIAFAVVRSL